MYKEINLKANTLETITTELLFEIAGARADGAQLIKVNIPYNESECEGISIEKKVQGIVKLLKEMKRKNKIQLYAIPESFLSHTTESVFLLNKYPFLSNVVSESLGFWFIIKL